MDTQPVALILGFSIHGLAVARALHSTGVRVHAISESGTLPTCKTKTATVCVDARINSKSALECIRDVAETIGGGAPIVLFPTNDKIVSLFANQWHEVDDRFLLSWSTSRDLVRELVRKDGFANFVDRYEFLAPKSRILSNCSNVLDDLFDFHEPLIVKPVVPLGSFKALRYDSVAHVAANIDQWQDGCPVIIQEWIDGDDIDLVFGTYFMDRGRILAEYAGRKLLSAPRALGQGVIVEHNNDEAVLEAGRQVARALGVSGPVAVEFKRGADGRLWLIEANVGRTEYSVDLLVASGLNLPRIEYDYVCGRKTANVAVATQSHVTWLDTDKEPLAALKYLAIARRRNKGLGKMVFPYFGHRDPGPLLAATAIFIKRLTNAAVRRCASLFRSFLPRPRDAQT